MPPSAGTAVAGGTIVEVAEEESSLNTFTRALKRSGILTTLSAGSLFTVFAPDDHAFADMIPGSVESLFSSREDLAALLAFHIVPGKITLDDLKRIPSVKTMMGNYLKVRGTGGGSVNNAHIVVPDIACSNGIIHIIDAVLVPGGNP